MEKGKEHSSSTNVVVLSCCVCGYARREASHANHVAGDLQRAVLSTKYVMSGAVDVPLHPPGMPYLKVPPMGDVEVTDEQGNGIGHVNFKTKSAPPPPPPTIIKFGDVGVAP